MGNRFLQIAVGVVGLVLGLAAIVTIGSFLVGQEYKAPVRSPGDAVEATPRDQGLADEHAEAEKAAKEKALGADEVIDHRAADVLAEVRRLTGKRGVDVVVENVGQETWEKSIQALAKGGRLVTCGATTGYDAKTDLRHLFFRGLSLLGSTMGSRAELLQIAELVGAKKLRPIVARVLPLDQAAEAHRLLAARAVFGKIVLTP